jgi:hypothetical protein
VVLSSRPQLSHAVFLSDWSFHSDSATSVNLVYISRASSLSLILQPGATRRTSQTTCGPLEGPSTFSKFFFYLLLFISQLCQIFGYFSKSFNYLFQTLPLPRLLQKLSKSFLFFIYFIVRRLVSTQCDGTPG